MAPDTTRQQPAITRRTYVSCQGYPRTGAVAALLAWLMVPSLATTQSAAASVRTAAVAEGVTVEERTEVLTKLDPALAALLAGAPGPASVVMRDGAAWVDVIVEAEGDAARAAQDLQDLGAQMNAPYAGSPVLTGSVPVDVLPAAAALASVRRLSASVPLHPLEGGAGDDTPISPSSGAGAA